MSERIIEKIKKCLALAGNNSNEAEAAAAALQAQKLISKYGIELAEIEDELEDEEIKTERVEVGAGKAWKYKLQMVVADNFKCKTFCYGKTTIAFYGHETDAKAAKEVFTFLFKLGHKLAMKERARVKNTEGTGEGAYNSFVLGFLAGIKDKLEAQSTELMIIVPQDVKEQYEELAKGFKTIRGRALSPKTGYNVDSYNKGREEGKRALSSREIESN